MLHALIMAGGGGTRFWPRSRQQKPKQFLSLTGDRTLLQQAFDRIEATISPQCMWVITSAAYSDQVSQQLPLPSHRIIGEPFGRDTAACIGLGACLMADADPDAIMLVMPADHIIEPAQQFQRAIRAAEQITIDRPSALVTFGISPTYPATGYGYIQRGGHLATRQGIDVFHVNAFREKPKPELAQQFLAEGGYFWNSGIFLWKVDAILQALQSCRPELYAAVRRIADAWKTPERDETFRREYQRLERISIDYAVMENARNVLVVEAPFQWDDVGSWLAVERLHPQDADDNTVLALHAGQNTKRCIIVADEGHLIATAGVQDLLIVQDGNVTLIADRRDESAVKELVQRLREMGLEDYL
ncbi:MAG: mannose-1-phosphate guanylyltransferase [Gemmatales bacterium]|nr:MAG: mannose-1-phosphate guanylyltransferase [Gemmatales bacterium]